MSYLDTYLGQLDAALSDPAVMELAINADGSIWLERAGQIHMTPSGLAALPARAVRDLAAQIANSTSNTFTETAPLVSAAVRYRDLMLRCQVVGTPAVSGGTVIGIRVFRSRQGDVRRTAKSFSFLRGQENSLEEERRAMVAEIRAGSEGADVEAFLGKLVSERLNVIVSGGTSTGKTELGRKLLEMVAPDERIVTIEDSLELLPGQPNTVSLIAQRDEASPRSADKLLQATLRLRPDRIILGELRGAEAATFLDAINTGHSGSFTTLHAHSARKAMDRLALLVMAQGTKLSFGEVMVFGKLGSPSKTAPYVSATFQKFPHCLVVAPTRAGKGVGYVIPNTLLFNGSIVVLDVKGEIFEATSRHRQAEGDAVYRFSPFDFEHPTHRYNPLERVARVENLEQRYTELAKISDYFLTVSDKGTAGDFLTEGRELFVAAGLLAIERGKPTIGEISRILFGRGATQEVYGEHAEEVKHPNAAQTFRKFAGYSDRTLSSHASVLGGAGMTLWNNPAVDRATSGNDFSFADLRKRPMSIYVVVNADDIRTLSPLVRLFFGELIATMRSTLPDPKSEPWPVMVMLDEFDQLGPMPIVEQALKQLAGHGARVSIITQSIPGLDNIYGENVRLSLESAAGMKLYLAANDKKTAGEISDALGKTTKLSVSDSVSRDRDFMQRRSVSRRMEERPLLTPDEVRRLNPDQAILIPERQNPLLVRRIVYFQDPTFKKLFEAQKGPLPYPPKEAADVQVLTQRMEALERRLAERMVVDFVRPEKVKAEAPVEPEPKLAAEIVAREKIAPEVELAAVNAEVLDTVTQPEVGAEPTVDLAALKPPITISVSRMSKFSQKLTGVGGESA